MAEKLRSEYEFGHTTDAKVLPKGESSVAKPTLRLFKPFDELVVDFQVQQIVLFIHCSAYPIQLIVLPNKFPLFNESLSLLCRISMWMPWRNLLRNLVSPL